MSETLREAAPPQRLTVAEAARELGVAERTVRRRIEKGTLMAVKESTSGTGVAYFIEREALESAKRGEIPPPKSAAIVKVEAEPLATVEAPERGAQIEQIGARVERIEAYLAGEMAQSLRAGISADIGEQIGAALKEVISPVMDRVEELARENATLKAEFEQVGEVERENERLKAEVERLKLPWWKRLSRK